MPVGISMNPLHGLDPRMWRLIFSVRECREILVRWITAPPLAEQERTALATSVRASFFKARDDPSMQTFLELHPTVIDQAAQA